MKLSIVIPCYNESRNIPLLISDFGKNLRRNDVEMIIVENGSTDDSGEVLTHLAPYFPFLKIVHLKENRGYGFGIISGLKEAEGEFLAWTHADLQTDPGDTLKALEIIESRGDARNIFVKGARRGRPLADNIFTFGMSAFETIYLGVTLWDINAQPNVFHRSFFARWENPPNDFSLDLYAFYMARKLHLSVIRFPVVFPGRRHGHSTWNTGLPAKWKFIKRTFDFSVRLKHDIKHGIHSSQDKHN